MNTYFRYATVELMPYPDLGEFVIIGVVAVDSDRNLMYRLLPKKRTTRLTQFFPEINRKIFIDSIKSADRELENIASNLNGDHGPGTQQLNLGDSDATGIFNVLTAPREGMIRISSHGTGKCPNLAIWLDEAYERFVLRTTGGIKDPAERQFTQAIRKLLEEWNVAQFYKERKVGDDRYHAVFPFTYQPEGQDSPGKVLKPLHLAHETPTRIMDHGDTWLQKMRRLTQFGAAPECIIFPVQLPVENTKLFEERAEVAHFLIEDFKRDGIEIIDNRDQEKLRASVEIPQVEELLSFSRG